MLDHRAYPTEEMKTLKDSIWEGKYKVVHAGRPVKEGELYLGKFSSKQPATVQRSGKGTVNSYPILEEIKTMSQVTRNQTLYLMDGISSLKIEQGYTYLYRADEEYAEGDLILIPNATGEHFKTAVVASIDEFPDIDESAGYNYKFVVGKVSLGKYEATLEAVEVATKRFAQAKHAAKRAQYRAATQENLGLSLDLLEVIK